MPSPSSRITPKRHTTWATPSGDQGRLPEAEASYRQALSIKAGLRLKAALTTWATPSREQGRLTEAEASLRQALSLKPDSAEAHNNLGNTLKEQGRLTEAEASYPSGPLNQAGLR